MPSIRGSSNYRAISGITVYGSKGLTGPTGATGFSVIGPTGSTASLIISNIVLSGYSLINYFTDGSTYGASGAVVGITGNTIVYLDGKTGSTGTGFIFSSSNPEDRDITIRKIKGFTGFRAFVGITSSDDSITITVDRYDAGVTLTAGNLSEVISTNFQNDFIGATAGSIKYGDITNTIRVLKTNVYEKTKSPSGSTGSLTYTASTESVNIFIDPVNTYNNFSDRNSLAKIFSIDFNEYGSNNIEVTIANPLPDKPIGFSLHVKNGPGILNINDPTKVIFKNVNGIPVLFPLNKQPCLYQEDQSYLIHFISIKDNWYGYIFGKESGSGNYFCDNNYRHLTQSNIQFLQFYNGLTGACCKSDGTCTITTSSSCSGFFSGVGTTCGAGITSSCNENIGSCCVKNTVDGKINNYCIDNISAYDCLSLNSNSVKTIFSGFGKTCKDVNCQSAFDDLGACCDGKGHCEELTKEECISQGSSFLGTGILCYSESKTPICSEGTGACCSKTKACTNTSAANCFSSGGYYHGDGTTCAGVTCSNELSCGGFLGINLQPGDIFGGGLVVGIYNPNGSKLLGAKHAFSRQGMTATFMNGGETFAEYYASEIDFIGYGVTGESCLTYNSQDVDSYYIIVSLYPASVNKVGNLIDPTEEAPWQEKFAWYGNGIAWGPILNLEKYTLSDFTYLDKTYEQYYLQYKEGYYGVTGESINNIISVTLQSCAESRKNGSDPIARLFTRNIKTSNGLWNRNWGLYNTIRLVSADNADYLGIQSKPYINGGFTSGTELTAARVIGLFNNNDYSNDYGITANPKELSDWYIPSHDELAFLAANTVSDATNQYLGFNLNSSLLVNGGVPLYDWYWSSTGSFNTGITGEGMYNSGKVDHGSVAWSIYFDSKGDSNNFKTKKENRSEHLKVRAIRAIRCDGKIPQPSTPQYKLWRVPSLLRNIK